METGVKEAIFINRLTRQTPPLLSWDPPRNPTEQHTPLIPLTIASTKAALNQAFAAVRQKRRIQRG